MTKEFRDRVKRSMLENEEILNRLAGKRSYSPDPKPTPKKPKKKGK